MAGRCLRIDGHDGERPPPRIEQAQGGYRAPHADRRAKRTSATAAPTRPTPPMRTARRWALTSWPPRKRTWAGPPSPPFTFPTRSPRSLRARIAELQSDVCRLAAPLAAWRAGQSRNWRRRATRPCPSAARRSRGAAPGRPAGQDQRHAPAERRRDPDARRAGARCSWAARPTWRPRHPRSSRVAGDIAPGSFGGRNFHFGVREHAMGAHPERHGTVRRVTSPLAPPSWCLPTICGRRSVWPASWASR